MSLDYLSIRQQIERANTTPAGPAQIGAILVALSHLVDRVEAIDQRSAETVRLVAALADDARLVDHRIDRLVETIGTLRYELDRARGAAF